MASPRTWLQPLQCEEKGESSKHRQQQVLETKKSLERAVEDLGDKRREAVSASKDAIREVASTVGLAESKSADAEVQRWTRSFEQISQEVDSEGVRYMDEQQFISAIAPKADFIKIGRRQYGLLFKVADQSRRGQITLDEFIAFQRLLKKPDAEFRVAWFLFDVDGNGELTADEFKAVFSENLGPKALPFDFSSNWLKMYMGSKQGQHVIRYTEFTQVMKGLQGERVRQAFRYLDRFETGYISGGDFARIVKEVARHKLSDSIIDRLPTITQLTDSGSVSYSELRAFCNVIKEIDLVEIIVKHAVNKTKDSRVSRDDFLDAAGQYTRYGVFTPLEADIIFHFASPKTDESAATARGSEAPRLRLRDFNQLFDPKWEALESEEAVRKPSLLHDIGKAAYNFGLGGIAGGLGATAVYPIDLVKTRMQNQRSKVVGEVLYRNSIDCVKKVYANEGFKGFYRGLPPQLIGVAPEKAIKLTVNDFVRRRATDPETGKIKLGWEIAAGGIAGGSQVIFTNPLEIVKIRLQMQGEAMKKLSTETQKKGAMFIVRSLGVVGLYKGAAACLMRDVPFSAIYFTAYNHLKKDYFKEGVNGKKLADVVKTRLQSEARKGDTHYKGLFDALRKIPAEEGFGALFKGGPARVLRSSPQFGVTLVAYETLQALLPYPFDKKSSAIIRSEEDLTKIRARRALRVLLDIHEDFGLRRAYRAASMADRG